MSRSFLALCGVFCGATLATAHEVTELPACKELKFAVSAVALSPDGKTAAISTGGSRDGEIVFWDLDIGKSTGTIPQNKNHYTADCYRADGKYLYAYDRNGKVVVLDIKTSAVVKSLPARVSFGVLTTDPAGKRLGASVPYESITVWDLENDKVLMKIDRNRA